MAATERITMTMRELDRFRVIQDVADGKLKPWRAAERLELTTRQVRRLVARLREHGPAGLVSGHRAKPGNRRLDPGAADRALSIIRDRYADFGPTLACEKLWECHGIRLAKETVRKLMTDAGLWVPRRQRPPKVYQPRARRACLGELIQIDGSEHRWFEDRAPQCTLLVYVDDATSRLMMLHFTQTESTFSYFEATRSYIERHGKPVVDLGLKPGRAAERLGLTVRQISAFAMRVLKAPPRSLNRQPLKKDLRRLPASRATDVEHPPRTADSKPQIRHERRPRLA
ncbi:integrase [Burkholderia lata]|nr:integrase [Burkholderia lata]